MALAVRRKPSWWSSPCLSPATRVREANSTRSSICLESGRWTRIFRGPASTTVALAGNRAAVNLIFSKRSMKGVLAANRPSTWQRWVATRITSSDPQRTRSRWPWSSPVTVARCISRFWMQVTASIRRWAQVISKTGARLPRRPRSSTLASFPALLVTFRHRCNLGVLLVPLKRRLERIRFVVWVLDTCNSWIPSLE